MKYIDAEKLIAEIEREYRSIENATGDYAEGRRAELENISKFITSLQQEQPSLPSNLDEAADCYKDTVTPEEVDDSEHAYSYETYTEYQIADAFKAGAKWMAGQGDTVEGVFKAGDPGYPDIPIAEQYSIEYISDKPSGIEPGDKVVVQIRKK